MQYKTFVASNPAISDYEAELAKFMDIESEIEAIPTFHNVGPLTLNTTNLKLQLGSESRQWKIQYSNKVMVHCGAQCVEEVYLKAESCARGNWQRQPFDVSVHSGAIALVVPVFCYGIFRWNTRAAATLTTWLGKGP